MTPSFWLLEVPISVSFSSFRALLSPQPHPFQCGVQLGFPESHRPADLEIGNQAEWPPSLVKETSLAPGGDPRGLRPHRAFHLLIKLFGSHPTRLRASGPDPVQVAFAPLLRFRCLVCDHLAIRALYRGLVISQDGRWTSGRDRWTIPQPVEVVLVPASFTVLPPIDAVLRH